MVDVVQGLLCTPGRAGEDITPRPFPALKIVKIRVEWDKQLPWVEDEWLEKIGAYSAKRPAARLARGIARSRVARLAQVSDFRS